MRFEVHISLLYPSEFSIDILLVLKLLIGIIFIIYVKHVMLNQDIVQTSPLTSYC